MKSLAPQSGFAAAAAPFFSQHPPSLVVSFFSGLKPRVRATHFSLSLSRTHSLLIDPYSRYIQSHSLSLSISQREPRAQ